jgi:hypothetical protein
MLNYDLAAQWLCARTSNKIEAQMVITGLKHLYRSISWAKFPVLLHCMHLDGTLDIIYLPAERKQVLLKCPLRLETGKLADKLIDLFMPVLINEFSETETEVLNIQFKDGEELLICLPNVTQQLTEGLKLTFI